jgi:hypothetical protein
LPALPENVRSKITQPEERTVTIVRTNDGWEAL